MEASATSASVKVSPNKVFKISLTAEQIVLVLNVLNEAHFKGSQSDIVSRTISAIQDPVLLAAHGGLVDDKGQPEVTE